MKGVGLLADSWTFWIPARALFMPQLSQSAKWGKLFPTSSYFAGSPSLSFLPPRGGEVAGEVKRWQESDHTGP